MTIGDLIPVEIAGTVIGHSVISEITDEYIEVLYYGHPIHLPPDVLDYIELVQDLGGM